MKKTNAKSSNVVAFHATPGERIVVPTPQRPKHLGVQSQDAIDVLDVIPWTGGRATTVKLDCSEFTSHCPVTKQPDFGRLVIEYVPDDHLVETKSLKLFLWRYRDRAAFNELIVDEIADTFFRQVRPLSVRVTGTFNPRGGIAVTATADRVKGDAL